MALLVMVALLSCDDDDDEKDARDAPAATAACPAGETCSENFGKFLLMGPYGRQISPPTEEAIGTAIGGTQIFTLYAEDGRDVNTPYPGTWHAALSDDAFFDVEKTSVRAVKVTARVEGTSLLDVRDDDGKLIDRVELVAAPIAKALLQAGVVSGSSPISLPSPFSLYPGSARLLSVLLEDATGQVLVDQGTVVTGGTQQGWNAITVTTTTAPHVTIVASDGFTSIIDVPVAIPASVALFAFSKPDFPCFEAFDADGHPVVFAPWTIAAPGGASTQDFCIAVGGPAGDYPLDITFGTLTMRITYHKTS